MRLIKARSAFLLLALCLPLWAQTAALDATQANLRKHIEYLASDKLEGRRTGEPGAALAAKYIRDQFAKVGLKPGASAGNGKASFMQRFPKAREAARTFVRSTRRPTPSFVLGTVIG